MWTCGELQNTCMVGMVWGPLLFILFYDTGKGAHSFVARSERQGRGGQ